MIVRTDGLIKTVTSPDYNYKFDLRNGNFCRWGKTLDDDPVQAPHPEIADIEVTTICSGLNGKVCAHCYKSNTPMGFNMSLDLYRKILYKISASGLLTQVAFGADSTGYSNPELIDMMEFTRSQGVIPNITVADIDTFMAKKLAGVCGAVAVSRYENKEYCYNSIARLAEAGLQQINIHLMISKETYHLAEETIKDIQTDPRLKSLKALVMLSLKQKGRGTKYTPLTQKEFHSLVKQGVDAGVSLGFDSCSAIKFLNTLKKGKEYLKIKQQVEPCESTLFSIFINYRGEAFPCSFADGIPGWERGIPVIGYTHFYDVWHHERMIEFRNKLLETSKQNSHDCRECPLFKV
jgi:hypothetical protein